MNITKKDLDKNQVELTIEVSLEEIKPHLEKAAQKLSQKTKIPGFRPGKAPFEMIEKQVGAMAIHQAALEAIISDSFYKAVTREKLQSVGQPEIKVEKLAPGNPLVYVAIVSLMPEVKLGDWQKSTIKKKTIEANKEDIDKTIDQLKQLNVKETMADRAAKKGDKVEVDFEVFLDKVIIEGGKNTKYPVVIGESRMIPGFEEKLIGLKAKDKKEFELKFPDKYFQKNLAGKLATFKVLVLNVYERELPELNDEFAKVMGFDSVEKLTTQLKDNISQDKQAKENQKVEGEAIQAMVKTSTIGDLPENLIKNELHKMTHELEHQIMSQGMDMAGYLKSINKTKEDFQTDFRPQAIDRVKAALVLRQLSIEEKITIDDKEVEAELVKQQEMYKDNKEALKNIENPHYLTHLKNMLTNRKIIQFITEKIVK